VADAPSKSHSPGTIHASCGAILINPISDLVCLGLLRLSILLHTVQIGIVNTHDLEIPGENLSNKAEILNKLK
jgi:hypothetical protein